MKFTQKNRLDIIAIIVSIIALGFSMYSHFKNINLQEKYDILSTYGMPLNYQVEISDKTGEGNFKFDDTEINKGQIDIIPKIGGIEKVYAIHYYKNNVKAILPVELYSEEVEKDDMSNIKTRIYSDIDLLHKYNENINVLPEFDASQMNKYQDLKNKLDEILIGKSNPS